MVERGWPVPYGTGSVTRPAGAFMRRAQSGGGRPAVVLGCVRIGWSELGQDQGQLLDALGRDGAQVSCEAFPVLGAGSLARWQGGKGVGYLRDGQPNPLRGTDHRHPAAHVGEEAPVSGRSAFAGQEPVIVVPAHRRAGDTHTIGDLTDAEPRLVPVVHLRIVATRSLDFDLG